MSTRPTPPADSPLLTPEQAATQINQVLRTNVSARGIRRRIAAGKIDGFRLPDDGRGTVRLTQAAVDEFLRQATSNFVAAKSEAA